MTENINAEIVAIGTEILLGEITDTNSVFIAKALRDIGINLFFMTSVGDNEKRIADAIRIAMGRSDVVITCGGLGPTIDDMTRQAVADATNRELIFHQDLFRDRTLRLDFIIDEYLKFITFDRKKRYKNEDHLKMHAERTILNFALFLSNYVAERNIKRSPKMIMEKGITLVNA